MNENGLGPTRSRFKCSRIVGDVMGKYHPHGDASIYDTLVRLAQDFSMRYPLVDGQGNFGSVDRRLGSGHAVHGRRASPGLATEMLRDIDEDTVDFVPNYDGKNQEAARPAVAVPNLLVNGSSGIAVGMATNIPPHKPARGRRRDDRVHRRPRDRGRGPDAPQSRARTSRPRHHPRTSGIREAYETGRGRVRVQARAHIEPIGQGKEAIHRHRAAPSRCARAARAD